VCFFFFFFFFFFVNGCKRIYYMWGWDVHWPLLPRGAARVSTMIDEQNALTFLRVFTLKTHTHSTHTHTHNTHTRWTPPPGLVVCVVSRSYAYARCARQRPVCMIMYAREGWRLADRRECPIINLILCLYIYVYEYDTIIQIHVNICVVCVVLCQSVNQ